MEIIRSVVYTLAEYVWSFPENMGISFPPLLVLLLLGTGLFYTLRLGFIQLRKLGHSFSAITGKFDDPDDEGDIHHFQALTSALSATVGIGNIAGVATAIHYGGPGALFWMWITALFGMSLKFAECTLAHHYRNINPDGSASGGPMYYIEKGLGKRWKWLAVTFALCAVFSSLGQGNSIQSFTMADQLKTDLALPTYITGLFSATVVGLVIIGGIRRIGKVTSRLVPAMALIYLIGGLAVLILNYDQVPSAVSEIFTSAFSTKAEIGGFAGSTWLFLMTWGVKRGLFSNESGQGSAPIAHAAAKTREPVREGTVALMEPFLDTLIICTITGLIIVTTGVWHEKKAGMASAFIRQEAISIIRADAEVGVNGVIRSEDLFEGEFQVVEGSAVGVRFVRNHSVVEGAAREGDEWIISGTPVIALSFQDVDHYKPFSGTVRVADGIPSFVGKEGSAISNENVYLVGSFSQNGSPLTSWAFNVGLRSLLGDFGYLIVTCGVFLFAISTAISWSYYGDRATEYLFGSRWVMPYRIMYCIVHFIGAVVSLEIVWAFGDFALGLMAFPNLIAILVLSGKVVSLTRDYFRRH